jgi:AsmA-like protein
MSSLTSVAGAKPAVIEPGRPRPQRSRRWILVVALVLLAVLIGLGILYRKAWPFTQTAVIEDLAEASDSTVTIRSYRQTFFPSPGCIIEGLEFRHGNRQFKLITIDKLIVQGSYSGILRRHVPRVTAIGARVFIPPFGSEMTFKSEHSEIVVDEILANGSFVEFMSDDPHAEPFRFDVHEARLNDVRWETPILYHLKFHNPNPPGEIVVHGSFGAWAHGHPQDTPLSGEYTFDHADLSVYGGVGGLLASKGKFGGALQHIDITGTTETPDFVVKSGGHKVKLSSHFDAYVDAMHGDTFLKRVDVRFGKTNVIAEGSVAGSKEHKGKEALLRLTAKQARIEDLLGLFVTNKAPMSGGAAIMTQVQIPSGDESFLKRVRLHGTFGIDDGSFTDAHTQQNVNELSEGARGDKMDDTETALTDLRGRVQLTRGIAQFTDLTFGIPGARARMQGTYDILNYKIDLHGRMRVDSKISKTETGFKSLMLKVMDPIFKKKKKGEVVPVRITGTYQKPQFGLDLDHPQDKDPARQDQTSQAKTSQSKPD